MVSKPLTEGAKRSAVGTDSEIFVRVLVVSAALGAEGSLAGAFPARAARGAAHPVRVTQVWDVEFRVEGS